MFTVEVFHILKKKNKKQTKKNDNKRKNRSKETKTRKI